MERSDVILNRRRKKQCHWVKTKDVDVNENQTLVVIYDVVNAVQLLLRCNLMKCFFVY